MHPIRPASERSLWTAGELSWLGWACFFVGRWLGPPSGFVLVSHPPTTHHTLPLPNPPSPHPSNSPPTPPPTCRNAANIPGRSPLERDRLLHVLIIGGGPTGVEAAGELAGGFASPRG